jgi:hypothetical protein
MISYGPKLGLAHGEPLQLCDAAQEPAPRSHVTHPGDGPIGLPDHSWSSREYIWLPVHTDSGLTKQMDEQTARLLTPALQDLSRGRTQVSPLIEMIEEHEQEAASLAKAA